MRILGIETSCDDTGMAIVEAAGPITRPRFKVVRSIVSSQIPVHREFGGVVPNLAKREHLRNLPIVSRETLRRKNDIDAIAVTVGPGLDPALWTGIEFAKRLSEDLKKPLIGVNHLEGHLYSSWINMKETIEFPAIALIVSGGHTIIMRMDSLKKWKKLGETKDDAVGEAFDKVARMLGLPYPGGPEIEKLAKSGNPKAIAFPRPLIKNDGFEFSFSGLKTAVLYYLRDNLKAKKADISSSFQQSIIDVLVEKSKKAIRENGARSLILCGGVASNKSIRSALRGLSVREGAGFYSPQVNLNTDNAVMIAAAAYLTKLRKKNLAIRSQPNLNL